MTCSRARSSWWYWWSSSTPAAMTGLLHAARKTAAHASRGERPATWRHPSKSSGRTESRNWRNCPTNSSGVSSSSSSSVSSARMIPSDSISSSDTKSGDLGAHGHRHGVGGSARHDGPLLTAHQVHLGVVGRRPQLGDDHPLDADVERAQHVLHQVVGERARHGHTLQGVGDGGRLRAPDEDRQRPSLTLGLLQEEHRRVRLQVHPDSTEEHTDHD